MGPPVMLATIPLRHGLAPAGRRVRKHEHADEYERHANGYRHEQLPTTGSRTPRQRPITPAIPITFPHLLSIQQSSGINAAATTLGLWRGLCRPHNAAPGTCVSRFMFLWWCRRGCIGGVRRRQLGWCVLVAGPHPVRECLGRRLFRCLRGSRVGRGWWRWGWFGLGVCG